MKLTPTQRVNILFALGFLAAFFGAMTTTFSPEYSLLGYFGIFCGFIAYVWGRRWNRKV